jgi:hypothetical protein
VRRSIAFALVFALGAATGYLVASDRRTRAAQSAPPAVDFRGPVLVYQSDFPAKTLTRFHPHHVLTDGQGERVKDPPEDPKDVWIISLDGGRVRIAASREVVGK